SHSDVPPTAGHFSLSLHDALPISQALGLEYATSRRLRRCVPSWMPVHTCVSSGLPVTKARSEQTAVPTRCRGSTSFWRTRPRSSDRKSTRLNSSHVKISYAVVCLQ